MGARGGEGGEGGGIAARLDSLDVFGAHSGELVGVLPHRLLHGAFRRHRSLPRIVAVRFHLVKCRLQLLPLSLHSDACRRRARASVR